MEGGEVLSGRTAAVAQGAKFDYRRIQDKEFISTRGPILSPILVGLQGKQGQEAEVTVKFILESKEDTLSSRTRFK